MIITDQSTPLRKGTQASEDSSPPAGPPPPAYPGYQAINETHPSPPPAPAPPTLVITQRLREPAGNRFCKAFVVAILFWALFSLFVRTFVGMVSHRHGGWNNLVSRQVFVFPEESLTCLAYFTGRGRRWSRMALAGPRSHTYAWQRVSREVCAGRSLDASRS